MNILQQRTPGFSSQSHPSPVLSVSPNVPPWPGCSDSKPQLCCISFSPTAPGPSASTDGSAFKTHRGNASSRFCLLPPFSLSSALQAGVIEWSSKRQSGHFLTRYKCSSGSPSDFKWNPNSIPDSEVPHSPATACLSLHASPALLQLSSLWLCPFCPSFNAAGSASLSFFSKQCPHPYCLPDLPMAWARPSCRVCTIAGPCLTALLKCYSRAFLCLDHLLPEPCLFVSGSYPHTRV